MPSSVPFPHLTATTLPPPPTKVLAAYQAIFCARVANGEIKPLVLPELIYGIIPIVAYLAIDHRKRSWLYQARWAVWALVMGWQCKMLTETGSRSPANGFAAGLVASWGMVWGTTWLIWERPQFEGQRIRRRRRTKYMGGESQNGAMLECGIEHTNGTRRDDNIQELRKRDTKGKSDANGNASAEHRNAQVDEARNDIWEYYWEPYPVNISDRLMWILELLITFRMPGWNYAIPPLPPVSTKFTTHQGQPLYPPETISKSRRSARNILLPFRTRGELARYRVPRFMLGYVVLDIIKTTMMHDPYFLFGPTTYALPPHLVDLHPRVLTIIRQLLGGAGIIVAIELIFSLPPLTTLLIPASVNLPFSLTPPFHSSTWGSPKALLDQGLAGLWGTWWHQTFRFGFSAPYHWAVREGYIDKNSTAARMFALVCAFAISGFLHASGSFTETAHTQPLDLVKFFMSQVVGIIIQTQTAYILRPYTEKLPLWLRRIGNMAFILSWLHLTSSWLMDDFGRCKIWLFEPILFSFTRGLGYGVEEPAGWKGFFLGKRWEPINLRWYTGKHWWESGLAL